MYIANIQNKILTIQFFPMERDNWKVCDTWEIDFILLKNTQLYKRNGEILNLRLENTKYKYTNNSNNNNKTLYLHF